jgi:RHS repeat-associated protein
MTGWTHKQNGTRRVIYWNEENRVKQIDDNGKKTYFLYDDTGERVLKRGEHGETLYINRFYSIRNGELSTKHVFAGETRILSKLVKTPPTSDSNTDPTFPGSRGILDALGRGKGNKFGIFKRIDQGELPATLPVEKDQFYYHTDHLGSSNIITDTYGSVYQHLEYFPYGETWIEEGGSYGGNTPGYKFTGKELDPETGLYYYGARYYDPVLSRWISADPVLVKYLPDHENREEDLNGLGGIFTPFNLSVYALGHNNAINYKDPDGKFVIRIPFTTAYFYAEIKSKGGIFSIGITTSAALEHRHPKLNQLTPRTRARVERVLIRLEAKGWDPKIQTGLRTKEEQQQKVNEGHSQTKKSLHLDQGGKGSAAVDITSNKYGWQVKKYKEAKEFFEEYGKIAEHEGLEWGGKWKSLYDPAHSQLKKDELKKELKEPNPVKDQPKNDSKE